MAKLSIEERIAQLDARKRALQARLSKQDRARDTRRKVLLGALLLQRLEAGRDPEFTRRLSDWLKGELPSFLTREEDRKLFPEFIAQTAAQIGVGSTAPTAPNAYGNAHGEGPRREEENVSGFQGVHGHNNGAAAHAG